MLKFVLVVFLIPGPNIWAPQGAQEFDDPLECMARAAAIQMSEDSPLNAVCWPVPINDAAPQGEEEKEEPSNFKRSKKDTFVSL